MGCGHDYESTPEELEAQRKYREQQAELEKHTIFALYQFDKLAKPDPAEIGGKFNLSHIQILYSPHYFSLRIILLW
jgi:hypothetical protein